MILLQYKRRNATHVVISNLQHMIRLAQLRSIYYRIDHALVVMQIASAFKRDPQFIKQCPFDIQQTLVWLNNLLIKYDAVCRRKEVLRIEISQPTWITEKMILGKPHNWLISHLLNVRINPFFKCFSHIAAPIVILLILQTQRMPVFSKPASFEISNKLFMSRTAFS